MSPCRPTTSSEHVRLGYAATEHGWQSDTVDTAIALTSPVTTRRGLYVAATRGRNDNILCVVTDSDDIAEARDVLDAILAVDRADIPATTQRRALAQSAPRQAAPDVPTATPRCEIPEWFPGVLAEAQRALRDAETREAQQSARRAQATAAAASARLRSCRSGRSNRRRSRRRYTTPRPERSKHAGVMAPHNIDSTPPLAGNAATCAATSTPPSSSSNAPRTTSSAPVDEPAPPSNATPGQSPTSATRTTSSAAATPSTSSTRWCPPSANTASTSKLSPPGSAGPKATTSPMPPSTPPSPCSPTNRASNSSSPPPSATTYPAPRPTEDRVSRPTSTFPECTSLSTTSASNCEARRSAPRRVLQVRLGRAEADEAVDVPLLLVLHPTARTWAPGRPSTARASITSTGGRSVGSSAIDRYAPGTGTVSSGPSGNRVDSLMAGAARIGWGSGAEQGRRCGRPRTSGVPAAARRRCQGCGRTRWGCGPRRASRRSPVATAANRRGSDPGHRCRRSGRRDGR